MSDDRRPIPAHVIYLLVAVLAITVEITLMFVEATGRMSVVKGMNTVLAGISVASFTGFLVSIAAERNRRVLSAQMAEMRQQLRESRPLPYAPIYLSRAHGSQGNTVGMTPTDQGETVALTPNGLDADSIQAARRISMRLARPDERG